MAAFGRPFLSTLSILSTLSTVALKKGRGRGILWGMKRIIMNIASDPLPETVAAGDELDVQLSPFGDFPGLLEGQRVIQTCDRAAFERLVANFSGEVLVDFEHKAEQGGDTEAAAWVQALRVDPEQGLMATFRFTDVGAEAVANRRLRFLSPVWSLDGQGRPERLISVGLTNKPNLPVRPILNREDAGTPPVEEKDTRMKEQLIAALGLAPEATDDDVVAAVAALKQRCDEQEAAALNAEAEQVAEENKDRIANTAAFKAFYVKNREAAKAMIACLAPTAKPAVCNKAEARAPQPLAARQEADRIIANKWEAMPHGAEKDAYLAMNKAAIMRALNEKE